MKGRYVLSEYIHFTTREEFRAWLEGASKIANESTTKTTHEPRVGVWLLFGKAQGPQTLKANEALEEALCFGWIDGQMKRLDDTSYIKYFSERRPNSNWSEKNKTLVEALETQGKMTNFGRAKIEEAKKNGQWDKEKAPAITDEQIAILSDILKTHEPAYTNFKAMPPSVQKTYTRAYFDAKTDAGRESRIAWMVERLQKNLKPM